MQSKDFDEAIASMPLIPALRGIQENEVSDVGKVLIDIGITVLEVPVRTKNAALSPMDDKAMRSLKKLIEVCGKNVLVTAGTVTQVEDLNILKNLGVEVCFSPGFNPAVVSEANRLGISFFPGVETFSESMNAVTSGAKGLKLFPSFFYEPNGDVTVRHSPGFVRYLAKFVSCPIIVSGGGGGAGDSYLPVSYLAAGAAAINVGSQIYEPNFNIKEIAARAKRFTVAIKSARSCVAS